MSQLNATRKWKNYKNNRLFKTIVNISFGNSKRISGQYFSVRDESEILRAVHMIEVHGFYSALKRIFWIIIHRLVQGL